MKTFAENVDYYINKFSSEFHSQFLKILSTSFQTRRVLATEVYEQLIDNRDHTHLNATRWGELTEYVMHLGKSGICRVDQKPEGWYIAWIDKSLTVMDKEMAKEKKQRIQVTEEERDRIAIRQQISKAAAAVLSEIRPGEITGASPTILLKSADEPIKLSLIPSSSSKPGFKPMSKKANPLSSKK